MSKSYLQLLNEHNALSSDARQKLSLELEQELLHKPGLVDYIDIITEASCMYKMVVKEIESLPRNNSARQRLALDFLTYVYKHNSDYLLSHDVEYCTVNDLGLKTFAIDYIKIKEYLNNESSTSISTWRILYLIQNSIYIKQEREVHDWYSAIKFMCANFGSETFLVANVDGLSFNPKGIRHDKFCAANGTSDSDFLYRGKKAEFKMAIKTVEALAQHAYNNPEYIYNASFLFTCEEDRKQYYLIDYTKIPYAITKISTLTENTSRKLFTIK